MGSLKTLKKAYDKLGNDNLRNILLSAAGRLGMRKDIIRMDTNGHCNIRCVMCNQTNEAGKRQFMQLEDYKNILDVFAPTARILYLSCGYEPLITPSFKEYLKYAKSKGIPQVSFCTNGLLIDQDLISSLIKYGIDEIIISFNGFCKEDYNRIMKGSDFERVCANIKAIAENKQRHNTEKPRIRLNSILMKSNLTSIDNLIDFMIENEIDTVQFRELMMYQNQNDSQEVENELPSNLTEEAFNKIKLKIQNATERLKAAQKEIILPAGFLEKGNPPKPSVASSPITGMSIQKKHNMQKQSCSIPRFSYWIDWKGDVKVCCYDSNAVIGNALKQNKKALKARRLAFQRTALAGECSRELCTSNIDSSTII